MCVVVVCVCVGGGGCWLLAGAAGWLCSAGTALHLPPPPPSKKKPKHTHGQMHYTWGSIFKNETGGDVWKFDK